MVRQEKFNSCWFHYLLLILLLAGATSGGLILLGCFDWEMPHGSQVVDRERQYDRQGGVIFHDNDPRTKAQVIVSPTEQGEKIKWYVPKGQPYLEISDPAKSNEITILRPPANVKESTVTVEGDYTKNGQNHHVSRHIHVTNQVSPY